MPRMPKLSLIYITSSSKAPESLSVYCGPKTALLPAARCRQAEPSAKDILQKKIRQSSGGRRRGVAKAPPARRLLHHLPPPPAPLPRVYGACAPEN
mmetsp:Transcript_21609/g.63432  ORF Transcript_21609/g.63432 Transcript_21609/m.63432 type:complete len:96 (-) Transcript_21609:80-367(-)